MALDFQTIVAFHRYWLFRPQKVENVELVDKTGNAGIRIILIPLSNDVYSKNRNEMLNI